MNTSIDDPPMSEREQHLFLMGKQHGFIEGRNGVLENFNEIMQRCMNPAPIIMQYAPIVPIDGEEQRAIDEEE